MARGRSIPSPYKPQLATLVKTPPEGNAWVHELKYDGYRIGAVANGRDVQLISRNGLDWTAQFPGIVAALAGLKLRDALLDGEVCAVLPDGRTSFSAMQHFRAQSGATLVYFVFDALKLDGAGITNLSLEKRKARLAKRIPHEGRVLYVSHVEGDGADVLREACALGGEGIISKKRGAPYAAGRSTLWLKTKCITRQEFVIGGWTEPSGARQHVGALLIGYYDEEQRLVFAGKVGTGFTAAIAKDLRTRLDRLARATNPFDVNGPERAIQRSAHWVRPELIAEVAYAEITPGGHVRHPSFQGLRKDKAAKDVRRE